jgi:hypothetical protein
MIKRRSNQLPRVNITLILNGMREPLDTLLQYSSNFDIDGLFCAMFNDLDTIQMIIAETTCGDDRTIELDLLNTARFIQTEMLDSSIEYARAVELRQEITYLLMERLVTKISRYDGWVIRQYRYLGLKYSTVGETENDTYMVRVSSTHSPSRVDDLELIDNRIILGHALSLVENSC